MARSGGSAVGRRATTQRGVEHRRRVVLLVEPPHVGARRDDRVDRQPEDGTDRASVAERDVVQRLSSTMSAPVNGKSPSSIGIVISSPVWLYQIWAWHWDAPSAPAAPWARARSSLGGVVRFGDFVGPFIAAGVVHLTGTTQSAFWIH
ncbi:hypothetical protein IAE22_30690, partial [Bacillus sp. S34]|nr:hypothetical protein [Bacillus sp. S34]